MKTTEHFKQTIQAYLEQMAANDPLFAEKYRNPKKNIDDCVTYILNWVKQSGCNGFTDDEIFGQAVHYYDEDDIDIGTPVNCQVVVNHAVELTEQEKEAAKQAAIRQYQQEQLEKMKERNKPKAKAEAVEQPSLFG